MSIDTVLGIIGTLLGIIGILAGYIFYLKGKREKDPCYSVDEVNLIRGYSSIFRDLKIRYKRKPIENLTITKLVFWNNGMETIDGADIQTTHPLMIFALEDGVMLDIKLLKSTNLANNFSTVLDEKGRFALLFFDYLNSKDGAVIQVIHTGISIVNLVITGEIKGVRKIQYKTKREALHSRVATIIMTVWMIIVLLLSGFSTFMWIRGDTSDLGPGILAVSTLIILFFAIVYQIRKSRDVARIPKELSIFEKADESFEKQ
jgi:hypothetical protein